MLLDIRSVQRALATSSWRDNLGKPLAADGDRGAKSLAAASFVLQNMPAGSTTFSPSWPADRIWTAAEQWAMSAWAGGPRIPLGTLDGIAGPRSQAGAEKWQDWITFTRAPLPDEAVKYQPTAWPRQADVRKFYGEPGKNQAMLVSPYPLYLDWNLDQKVGRFSIHEKVHDAALRVMQRVLDHYGPDAIHKLGLDQFGGCLNVRPMRNGTTLSMHAWGIAIDWDADRNPLRATSKTALLATPPYAKFLDLWEAEGFISLGRARNYDWMHVQAARL